jgi:hypothetical protein
MFQINTTAVAQNHITKAGNRNHQKKRKIKSAVSDRFCRLNHIPSSLLPAVPHNSDKYRVLAVTKHKHTERMPKTREIGQEVDKENTRNSKQKSELLPSCRIHSVLLVRPSFVTLTAVGRVM